MSKLTIKHSQAEIRALSARIRRIADDDIDGALADERVLHRAADMLNAYASLLEQMERAREGVTRTIQEAIECLGDVAQYKGNLKVGVYRHIVQKLHDLLAVAHLLPGKRGGKSCG